MTLGPLTLPTVRKINTRRQKEAQTSNENLTMYRTSHDLCTSNIILTIYVIKHYGCCLQAVVMEY